MRKAGSLLLLAALLAPAQAEAKSGALCPHFVRTYARLAELPPGAAAALGFPIAERGAPWNATDVIGPGPRLPFARFISARRPLDIARRAVTGAAQRCNVAGTSSAGMRFLHVRDRSDAIAHQ